MINEQLKRFTPNPLLVVIQAEPKDLGLPTEAYIEVQEVHDVRFICTFFDFLVILSYMFLRMYNFVYNILTTGISCRIMSFLLHLFPVLKKS